MKKSILIALCATSISFAAMVSAQEGTGVAILDEVSGSVLVNQGEKFVPATEGQSLNAGDRLMVTKTGNATLVFGKGCTKEVKGGTMVTIPETSICEGGQLLSQSLEPGAGSAPGAKGTGLGATGTGNAGIYTLAGIALAIGAYEMSKSP
ncbi:MAG: hypothetical protein ACREPB_12315 [Arenimonas sp.]